jgi:hypothetical protein
MLVGGTAPALRLQAALEACLSSLARGRDSHRGDERQDVAAEDLTAEDLTPEADRFKSVQPDQFPVEVAFQPSWSDDRNAH